MVSAHRVEEYPRHRQSIEAGKLPRGKGFSDFL